MPIQLTVTIRTFRHLLERLLDHPICHRRRRRVRMEALPMEGRPRPTEALRHPRRTEALRHLHFPCTVNISQHRPVTIRLAKIKGKSHFVVRRISVTRTTDGFRSTCFVSERRENCWRALVSDPNSHQLLTHLLFQEERGTFNSIHRVDVPPFRDECGTFQLANH